MRFRLPPQLGKPNPPKKRRAALRLAFCGWSLAALLLQSLWMPFAMAASDSRGGETVMAICSTHGNGQSGQPGSSSTATHMNCLLCCGHQVFNGVADSDIAPTASASSYLLPQRIVFNHVQALHTVSRLARAPPALV
ncbi:DUF2946 family protein [Herbaspirillum lusitanum]|uniref:DUF2946 family protein n=1 Tax=Herbaspirillum lusitanum TaxID=213312 RepID=A0ABW9AC89_9BURK